MLGVKKERVFRVFLWEGYLGLIFLGGLISVRKEKWERFREELWGWEWDYY